MLRRQKNRVEVRQGYRVPNRCFLRDLKIVDTGLYVIYDGETDTFDIYKNVDKTMGKLRWSEVRMIDSFRYLNDAALTQLRYRKHLGRKYETPVSPNRYIDAMDRAAKEKKAKIHEGVIDEMAANLKTVYDAHTKTHFHT